MRSNRMQIRIGFLMALVGALLLGGASARAQFQYNYGGSGTDNSKGAVQQTLDGGFISVGESNSTSSGQFDVYVVKTNANGTLSWAFQYDISGNDYGRGLAQITSDSGYIVTGFTDNANACTQNDVFLMRLDKNGGILWVKTYGGSGVDEGWHVNLGSNGEFLVAGRTTSFGQGGYDGLLLRTSSSGSVIWCRVFGGSGDDMFLSSTNVGDGYVMSGLTFSWHSGSGDYDAWLIRILSNGSLVWSNHYGGSDNELLRIVRQCNTGDLVAVGFTRSFGGNAEGLIIRVSLAAGAKQAVTIVGGQQSFGWDEFMDVRQLADSSFRVTGLFYFAPNGFGDYDVYLGQFNYNLNLAWSRLYGGAGVDQGWALNSASGAASIIIAGLTQNVANGEQMYMIRTTPMAGSGECAAIPDVDTSHPSIDSISMTPTGAFVNVVCSATATATADNNAFQECAAAFRSMRPTMSPAQSFSVDTFRVRSSPLPSAGGGPERSGAVAGVIDFNTDRTVSTYPNPIRAGRTLYLETSTEKDAIGEVIVTDVNGTVIYQAAAVAPAGSIRLPISTHGWASGTYVVKVTLAGTMRVAKVIVEAD